MAAGRHLSRAGLVLVRDGTVIGLRAAISRTKNPARWRGFFCVPSMIDSLEVEVLYPA